MNKRLVACTEATSSSKLRKVGEDYSGQIFDKGTSQPCL